MDSRDTSEAFFKLGRNGRESVVHHLGGFNSPLAYREGDFVLVPKGKGWELFNLAQDLGQKTDLAASMPEKVEAMKAKLYAIAPPKA